MAPNGHGERKGLKGAPLKGQASRKGGVIFVRHIEKSTERSMKEEGGEPLHGIVAGSARAIADPLTARLPPL